MMIVPFFLLICIFQANFINRSNALECYACDSAENVECATKPGQQINVEDCLRPGDECVSVIVVGRTRRGCLSRLFPNNYCPEPCDRCQRNLCNRHIFPTQRLRCYQCVGSECVNVTGRDLLSLPCPIYHEKDRCYTNIIRDSNVQRGCEYTNLPNDCPNVCLKCNYDGCNNETVVTTDSCHECTHTFGTPNPYCLRGQIAPAESINASCAISGTKYCSNKLMHGHSGQCFTHVNAQTNVVQRGCTSTMGFYPTGNLTLCTGYNCNNDCLTISCNNCTSSDGNSNCRSGKNLRQYKCMDSNAYACYSCEKGADLRRGCVDKLFHEDQQEACYQCRDLDGCNRASVRTCYHCSSLEDSNCIELMDSRRTITRNCSNFNELCVSTLVNKFNLTYILRGCASHVFECSNDDPFCVRCNGSLCNNFPLSVWHHQVASVKHRLLSNFEYHLQSNAADTVLNYKFIRSQVIIVIGILMLNLSY